MLGSLALCGFLLGLALGRLDDPAPVVLERVEVQADALQLWFNSEPQVRAEHVQGALVLRFEARGRAQEGQVRVAGKAVNWRLIRHDGGLLLNLVAARPLRGEWRATAADSGWRLTVSLGEE